MCVQFRTIPLEAEQNFEVQAKYSKQNHKINFFGIYPNIPSPKNLKLLPILISDFQKFSNYDRVFKWAYGEI